MATSWMMGTFAIQSLMVLGAALPNFMNEILFLKRLIHVSLLSCINVVETLLKRGGEVVVCGNKFVNAIFVGRLLEFLEYRNVALAGLQIRLVKT